MVGVVFVRKTIIHLATKIFGSTYFNHIPAEVVISYISVALSFVVVRNRKRDPLDVLCSLSKEVPARAVDDADVPV